MKWLKAAVEDIMRSDRAPGRWLAFFLFLLSLLYGFILLLRRFLFRKGVLRSHKLPCVVISVGNITLGGSGKTPMAIYLARLLSARGFRPAIVSRGYKGLFEKKGGIVSDGGRILASPKEAGDEPYMMAVKTGVPVVCGKDRLKAGIDAVGLGAEVIILDDGFQHLRLKRDMNLLLLDTERPCGNGHIVPRGMMREPWSAAWDADAFIMTRCRENHTASCHEYEQDPSAMPVFYASQRQYTAKESGINGNKVVAVSGIADNKAFAESLNKRGYEVISSVSFDDHHYYTEEDLENVLGEMRLNSADFIVTTEKDYVKISGLIKDDSAWEVLGSDHDFGEAREKFDDWIISGVRRAMTGTGQDGIQKSSWDKDGV